MTDRAWSIAPTFAPAATFGKFQGTPGENGRRWLRSLLFHYDNATPAQIVSLIDIHLVGEAAEWADDNEEVLELLFAEDSATDTTIERFKELFNKRFSVRSVARRKKMARHPPEHAVIQSNKRSNDSPQALALEDNHSLKRDRTIEDGDQERATKKTCMELVMHTRGTQDEAETGKTQFFTPPYFKWERFYQYSHETVEQYGHRALDLFTATGGVDRTKKKQHFFPGQLDYLGRIITYFVSGLQDVTLRRKIGWIAKTIKFNQLSLERLCATAHEYAQRQAQGIELSDNETVKDPHNKSGPEANRIDEEARKEQSKLKAREKREMRGALAKEQGTGQGEGKGKGKDSQANLNTEASPFAQYRLSDQARLSFQSNAAGQYMIGNGSIQFKPTDMRLRGVHALESIKSDESERPANADVDGGML